MCNGVKQGGILSPHLFNVYMDDLSVILNKLQIGCIYAGTIINHVMYADDLCIFSPSVSGLRKLTNCCEKYGDIFNITYNVNKSYCMVIDNKPQTMKYTHPVILNNNVLPYTTKCKYLGHIINTNLTDDDDIARQKRCFYAQANVLARKLALQPDGRIPQRHARYTIFEYISVSCLRRNATEYGAEAKKTQVTSQLWYKDTAGHIDATQENGGKAGLAKQRRRHIVGSRVVEMMGRLHVDLFMQDRFLLKQRYRAGTSRA